MTASNIQPAPDPYREAKEKGAAAFAALGNLVIEDERDTEAVADYFYEVIGELLAALDAALTCPDIWCMCDAHQMMRRTEVEVAEQWEDHP